MSHGLFENLLGSETEVGVARQASADKFNTAVYDVREKLGGFLFQAESLEDFRDRVAMTKNDQSLFKIIEGSGLHPATGIVRRIAGKNSVLEEEFRQKLAKDTPFGTKPTKPDTNVYRSKEEPYGQSWEKVPDEENWNPQHKKSDFEGVQDIDSTFSKEEQGKELKPKDDWKGYLNSVDQDAPSKVKRNFASKQAWNVYLAWCASNGKSAARLSSLDAYATNLSDVQYMKLANSIQACNDTDWGSDHHPKTPNTKLKKTDKVAAEVLPPKLDKLPQGSPDKNEWPEDHWLQDDIKKPSFGEWNKGRNAALARYIAWCDRNNLSKVAKSTIDYYVSKVAGPRYPHPGDEQDGWDLHAPTSLPDKGRGQVEEEPHHPGYGGDFNPRGAALRNHLYAQVATTIRWARTQRVACWPGCHENEAHVKKVHKDKEARRRTAAPDYLQKADDALTQLLNQKAQEFQETIAPLQQALQTVQQAEQLQQQANPLNVLPPAGTVNVMPGQGGDPSTASQVGMPDPNAQDTSGLAALLSGVGGTAPNDAPMGGGQGAPPPAAGGQGALPPEMDPNQGQQVAASRKRRRQARGVGEQFDSWKNKKTQSGDLLRGGDPDYEQFAQENEVGERALNKLKQRNQTPDFAPINRPDLQGVTVGSKRRRAYHDDDFGPDDSGTSDDFYAPAAGHEYHDPAQQNGWKMTHADDDGNAAWSHPSGHSVTGRDGPEGGHWQLHGPKGPMGHPHRSPEEAQRSMPRQASVKKARGASSPRRRRAEQLTGPFASYDNFGDCEDKNSDKGDSAAYCGEIHNKVTKGRERKGEPLHDFQDKQSRRKRAADPNIPPLPEQANPHSTVDGPQNPAPVQGGQGSQLLRQQQARRSQQRSAAKKEAWSGFGPALFPKTRKVAGWDYDDGLQAYIANAPRIFTCGCGQEHQTPNGYQRCKCGKAYNSYVIGTGGNNKEAAAEKFLVREIPVRENVIVGSRKTSGDDVGKELNKRMQEMRDNIQKMKKAPEPMKRPPSEEWDPDSDPFDPREFGASVRLVDPRTGNIHRLIDPGELDEGEDPGHPTFKKPPGDWARRGDGAKWVGNQIG